MVLHTPFNRREEKESYDEARGRLLFTLKEFAGEEGDIGDRKEPAVDGDPARLGEALRKLTAAKSDSQPEE